MAELKFSMNPGMKFPSRSVLREAAENVAEAGEVADGAAHHDASHENEGEFHCHRVLPRKILPALSGGGNFWSRFIVGFRGHSERAWRTAQDTTPPPGLQTGPRRERWPGRCS